MLDRKISIAPMMDCTDRHDRFFLRLISPHALLYSEMITANAVIYGDAKHLLAFHPAEHPVALQLGGHVPEDLAKAASISEAFGYDEINLNVGCPSSRVKSGSFGACLMLNPSLVADCVAAMMAAVKVPVTVKCRIGVDDEDSYAALSHFIATVAKAGCKVFIIHARKAWLTSLSPKENREIPPLRYDIVHQIKHDFPHLTIVLNGGIKTLADVCNHLQQFDGVMIGREAYANPYLLADLERYIFQHESVLSRLEVMESLLPYIEQELSQNTRLSSITRHIVGLYHGQKNGRLWRRYLSEHACRGDANLDVLRKALLLVI